MYIFYIYTCTCTSANTASTEFNKLLGLFCVLLFWKTQHVLHVLDLLKVERHVCGQHHLDDERPELPETEQQSKQTWRLCCVTLEQVRGTCTPRV